MREGCAEVRSVQRCALSRPRIINLATAWTKYIHRVVPRCVGQADWKDPLSIAAHSRTNTKVEISILFFLKNIETVLDLIIRKLEHIRAFTICCIPLVVSI